MGLVRVPSQVTVALRPLSEHLLQILLLFKFPIFLHVKKCENLLIKLWQSGCERAEEEMSL